GPIDAAALAEVAERFRTSYEREYTYSLDAPVEFVGAHLVAVAEVGKLSPALLPSTGRSLEEARKGRRTVDYATEGIHEADVYVGELLEPGMSFAGPAIVELKSSTVVIHPGNQVAVDGYGNLLVDLAPDREEETR
ncbi:MAG: hydantoinase/oxoprolinase family protein, partial [Gaiellaceae bacterium]